MRIALLCPQTPRNSPFIAYAQAIVPLLAEEHEVTIVLGPAPQGGEALPLDLAGETIPYEVWFAAPERFDVAFYQFGDRWRLHGFMFEALKRWAGVAILHNTLLHQALLWDVALQQDATFAQSELRAVYGPEGEALAIEMAAGRVEEVYRRSPILRHVLAKSLAVVAAQESVAHKVQRLSPPGFPVHCIPFPALFSQGMARQDPTQAERIPFIVLTPPVSEKDASLLQRAMEHLRHRWPQAVAIMNGEGWPRNTLPLPLPSEGIWWLDDLSPSRWYQMMATAYAVIFFAPPSGDLDASRIAQGFACGAFPIVIGDFEDPHFGRAIFSIAREHPQNWAILAAALDYLLCYPQRLEPLLALGKQIALEHYGPQRARSALQALFADLAVQRSSPLAEAKDLQDRIAIRESLSMFAGRALAELGMFPSDRAMLRPFANIIGGLIPPHSPPAEEETNQC